MEWEILVLKFLEGLRSETLSKIFEIITVTGESALLATIIVIIYWCVNKETGLKFGFIMLFSMVGNGFLKNLIKAPRPFESEVVVPIRKHTATGYSFPSGHTQGVTTFWVALMIHIKEKWIYYLGSIVIVLVGFSRLYLGVHWPVDILGAIFVGIGLTIIGQYIFEKIKTLGMLTLLFICIIVGSTLLLNFDSDYIKSLAAMIGLIVGMVLERRYISFSTKGALGIQFLKVILGLGGLVVVAGGLKFALPPIMIFDFFRYMAIVIWIIAGAPYLFKRLIK